VTIYIAQTVVQGTRNILENGIRRARSRCQMRMNTRSRPMRTALGVDTSVSHTQPLHWPSANQMLFHDGCRIGRLNAPIPHRIRVDNHRWPVFALVQAAGFVDSHLARETCRFREPLQLCVQFALPVGRAGWPWRLFRPDVVADKDVTFKSRQSATLQFLLNSD
jgi:hypothetical protein